MSMCESILTIALVCTVKYLHYCDYYYTLGNDSQSTPKLIAYVLISLQVASTGKNSIAYPAGKQLLFKQIPVLGWHRSTAL